MSRNSLKLQARTCVNLTIIMLNRRMQAQKITSCMFPFIKGTQMRKITYAVRNLNSSCLGRVRTTVDQKGSFSGGPGTLFLELHANSPAVFLQTRMWELSAYGVCAFLTVETSTPHVSFKVVVRILMVTNYPVYTSKN